MIRNLIQRWLGIADLTRDIDNLSLVASTHRDLTENLRVEIFAALSNLKTDANVRGPVPGVKRLAEDVQVLKDQLSALSMRLDEESDKQRVALTSVQIVANDLKSITAPSSSLMKVYEKIDLLLGHLEHKVTAK